MMKKKKIRILTGSILIVIAAILFLLFYRRQQAFKNPEDRQVLFLYYYYDYYEPEKYYGYLIDNYGNKIETDSFETVINYRGNPTRMTKLLLDAEKKKITHQFSAHQTSELCAALENITPEKKQDIQGEATYYRGEHRFLAYQKREDGKHTVITLYIDGMGHWENPDPYAQKIMKILLRKNPLKLEIDRKLYFDR